MQQQYRIHRSDSKSEGTNSNLASGGLSAKYRGPRNKSYILIALVAAILLAISQTIRGVESSNIFLTKFTLSMTYLVCSSLYFLLMKIRALRKDEVFYMPWYTA